MPKSIIVEGKTTAEAIEKGLKELNTTKNMVEIKTIEENGYKMWKEEYTLSNMCESLKTIYQGKGENTK